MRNSSHSTKDDGKCGSHRVKLMGFVVVCLMIVTVLFSVSVNDSDSPPRESQWFGAEARVLDVKQPLLNGSHDEFPHLIDTPKDKLLGGLLSAGFDEKSCLSRYESALFGSGLRHSPSPYLIARLRSYEALHKKCSPFTDSYNKTVEQLKSGKHPDPTDCNYVVWIAYSGLGNRMLSMASAFLYALLTNRVLLIDRGLDTAHLFCEPFPGTTWLLPIDFPLSAEFSGFDQKTGDSFGNKLKKNLLGTTIMPFVYLHLIHDYDNEDKLFFCEQEQSFLQSTPWLIMRSNNYFIPALFLIPSFEQELGRLFSKKEAVFHLLGRYLFHPTNQVWGLVTRYYRAYLAGADERIGIQVRVFDVREPPLKHVQNQILSCILKENILPRINQNEHIIVSEQQKKKKAVLVTALQSAYYEEVRDMYWEYPTITGEIVSVYQPSNEQHQNEKEMHNMKAWAEIYLLSLTDTLVTSAWSTFGYVAQGLGGLKPWIMYKPENDTTPDPPCGRAMSMEPCFMGPPCIDCKTKIWTDTGKQASHVQHCEDMSWGVKLVDI